MKLTFIRADHEVTGSCTLLEIGGHYGLIDCGMEQGRDLFENIAIPVPAMGAAIFGALAGQHGIGVLSAIRLYVHTDEYIVGCLS